MNVTLFGLSGVIMWALNVIISVLKKKSQREISLSLMHTGEDLKNRAERDPEPLKIKAMEP